MIQLIFIISLTVSLILMIVIFWKKIPILIGLSEKTKREKKLLFQLRERIKSLPFCKNFSWNGILLKTLSKIRVAVLKVENKISVCLQSLREKSQKSKK